MCHHSLILVGECSQVHDLFSIYKCSGVRSVSNNSHENIILEVTMSISETKRPTVRLL